MDRGFGRCIVYRKYTTQIKKYPNQSYDRIVPPPANIDDRQQKKYNILDNDGICSPGFSKFILFNFN